MPIDTTAPAAPRLVTGSAFKALVDPEVILQTSMGNVLLELNTARAGTTVANMLAYVHDGFYDGTIFHRVIPGFMVQGGGLTPGLGAELPTYAPIPLESNNGLSNLRGTLAMARTPVADSATSQFFINLVDNIGLNYASADFPGYAVFGKVVTGMSVIDNIAAVPTTTVGSYADVPFNDVVIHTALQTSLGSTISNTGVFSLAGLESGGHFDFSLDGGTHWLTGAGTNFTVPAGTYAANTIQVRQFDAAGNQSLVARFADVLNVNPANIVTANKAPTGALYVTGTALLGQTLTVDASGLSDADGAGTLFAPNIQWLRGGDFVIGAVGSSYTLSAEDVGAAISMRLTYTDALGRVEHVAPTGALLAGDSGDNTLNGSFGTDTLAGGLGNDVYVVDSAFDRIIESADGGIDEVRASVSYPFSPGSLASNVENLTLLGNGNYYGLGNNLANSMMGNKGANTLLGGGGNDTLEGNDGNDSLDGGDNNDNLGGGFGFDTLIGGLGDDTLRGGDQGDLLAGGDGNDYLSSGKGLDYLMGGNGNDQLLGLLGNDTLTGDAGFDTLDGGEGDDNLNGGLNGDTLVGGLGNDLLGGGNGLDRLDGGDGNDSLIGGLGTDTLTGGAGADQFRFLHALDGATNIDTITDLQAGVDVITLSVTIFTAYAAQIGATVGASDNLLYNASTGAVAYDADGVGGNPALTFAILGIGTHPATLGNDFLIVA